MPISDLELPGDPGLIDKTNRGSGGGGGVINPPGGDPGGGLTGGGGSFGRFFGSSTPLTPIGAFGGRRDLLSMMGRRPGRGVDRGAYPSVPGAGAPGSQVPPPAAVPGAVTGGNAGTSLDPTWQRYLNLGATNQTAVSDLLAMIAGGGLAGHYDPNGNANIVKSAREGIMNDLGARQSSARLAAALGGGFSDPTVSGLGEMLATIGTTGDAARAAQNAQYQQALAAQQWYRNMYDRETAAEEANFNNAAQQQIHSNIYGNGGGGSGWQGILGGIGGAGLGALFGNPMIGAQIGSSLFR